MPRGRACPGRTFFPNISTPATKDPKTISVGHRVATLSKTVQQQRINERSHRDIRWCLPTGVGYRDWMKGSRGLLSDLVDGIR